MTDRSGPQAALQQVRDVLQRHVQQGSVTGAVVLLAQGNNAEVVAAGTTALDSTRAMQRDTIFRIASLTKPITAAVAMMLIEDGRLRLEEPVDRLLPELAERRVLKRLDSPLDDAVPARRPITLEDLLSFRCGLGVLLAPPGTYPIQRRIAELGLPGFGPPDPASPLGPDEWLRRVGGLPLMAQPGETWLYTAASNILGVLIARAAGKPLPEVLQERIFAPLGMLDTGFFVPPAKQARLPAAYRPGREHLELYDAAPESAWGRPPAFPAGDSGLVGTAEDYFMFTRALSRSAPHPLLSRASIAAMTADHLTLQQRQGGQLILGPDRSWGYGLGVYVATSAEGVPAGTWGWDGGTGTSWRFDPASERTVIVLTQTQFSSPQPPQIHQDVWRSVFTG